MFFGVVAVLMLGFPVAFTLAGTSLIFAGIGWQFDAFNPALFGTLVSRYVGAMVNEVLVAVPLFVFMGVMLERSRIAEQLLVTMAQLFGSLRGGLGLSVIMVGALLAASTGIVGATVVTMGLLSLPAMLTRRLRSEARLRHHLRLRHARPDHPALDRPDLHGGHPPGSQCPGSDGARQLRPQPGVRRRPVRRRLHPRLHPGRPLHGLDHSGRDLPAAGGSGAGDECRGAPRPAEERRRGARSGAGPDRRGAGLHPCRHRHADRIRFGRCRRSHAAGRRHGGSSATRSCGMS